MPRDARREIQPALNDSSLLFRSFARYTSTQRNPNTNSQNSGLFGKRLFEKA